MRKVSSRGSGAAEVIEAAGSVHRANEILRIRKIARLDQKGLEPPEIAAALERANPKGKWRLEEILYLMGRYPDADMVERRQVYQGVSAEVSSNELVDVDEELAEMKAMALRNLRHLAEHSEDEKIRMAACDRILKLNGVDSVQVEKKIIEHKMDVKTIAALVANAESKPRRQLLPDLISEDKAIIDGQIVEDEP